MYIARAVCVGMPLRGCYSYRRAKMPQLNGKCKELYERTHGDRYDHYLDGPGMCHGGTPLDEDEDRNPIPAFCHRPDHDVESIYWTMVAALLRVHPDSADREEHASEPSAQTWGHLNGHTIPNDSKASDDARDLILNYSDEQWTTRFDETMADVAALLHKMSGQVAPEYGYVEGIPHEDHLHESAQRLLLQYLYDHRDNDVVLDPEHHRPTQPRLPR